MRELKRYKEEAVAIILLFVGLFVVRWLGVNYFSTGREGDLPNQYDLRSECETIVFVALRLLVFMLFSWGVLRVVMPDGYKFLKHGIVDGFKHLNTEQKSNTSTRMWGIIFLGMVLLSMSGCAVQANDTRQCVVSSALYDVGVREATGHNDGTEVERYLSHVNLGKGNAWCAAFVCYHFSECAVTNPRSAWSPSIASGGKKVWTPRKAVRDPLPGDVFALYYPSLGRVGHVGFVTGRKGKYITTVEGNTSGPGSREGDGVYARRRELSKVHSIINYIADETVRSSSSGALRSTRMQGQAKLGERHVRDGQYGGHRRGPRYDGCHSALRGDRALPVATSWTGQQARHAELRTSTGDRSGAGRGSAGILRVRHGRIRSTVARQVHAQRPTRNTGGQVGGGPLSDTLVACTSSALRSNDHHTSDHQVGA